MYVNEQFVTAQLSIVDPCSLLDKDYVPYIHRYVISVEIDGMCVLLPVYAHENNKSICSLC